MQPGHPETGQLPGRPEKSSQDQPVEPAGPAVLLGLHQTAVEGRLHHGPRGPGASDLGDS
jgi:hypothetical protein